VNNLHHCVVVRANYLLNFLKISAEKFFTPVDFI
jgi:hypothetical protein